MKLEEVSAERDTLQLVVKSHKREIEKLNYEIHSLESSLENLDKKNQILSRENEQLQNRLNYIFR